MNVSIGGRVGNILCEEKVKVSIEEKKKGKNALKVKGFGALEEESGSYFSELLLDAKAQAVGR